MALKKPLNSFARARKVGHNSAKKQRQIAIAQLQHGAKGKSEALPETKKSHLIPKKNQYMYWFFCLPFFHIKALIYGTASLVES